MGVKYIWWSYAKQMIRIYPQRKREYEYAIAKIRSPIFDELPARSSTRSDPVSTLLAKIEQTSSYKEYSAVHSALNICQEINPDFMEFVKMYYWQPRSKPSLEDVADKLHYSPETVRKWNKRLLYAAAQYRGLMD